LILYVPRGSAGVAQNTLRFRGNNGDRVAAAYRLPKSEERMQVPRSHEQLERIAASERS
jgi:hypothetical protein